MSDLADPQFTPLSIIYNRLGQLDHPLYRALAHPDYPQQYRYLAIESALRTRHVPVCGYRVTALGLESPERIENKLDAETEIALNHRRAHAAPCVRRWRLH
jgi:hypothetical protein